ncbi:M48 family metallopeptidase [Pseudoalteromonas sp. MMG012]|uniref:M48 family metallopeptidase n=1 Tax=Pseudoalteromonas sp. MMG012 TaxID=2822686 RepID=UPI001B3A3E69|nr:M48 family metallopeptidase [Pseudoalteromonas sp. MMG012]MBQ4852156.1 M48 family metallopeptidase [Pseudoalteromonas sp. MMG012]
MNSNLEHRIRKEKQKQWLWIAMSALLVVLFASYQLYTQAIPYLAQKIAVAIPQPVYQAVDKHTLTTLDDTELSKTQLSELKQQEISTLFSQLIDNKREAQHVYTLEFRNWEDQANAMALANGTIIITDAMVTLAADQQELSAILLHEIGHIEHNHVMESIVSSSLVFVGLGVILGDVTALSDLLLQGTIIGITQSYSKQAELEADKYASEHLIAQYGDHHAMSAVFQKLATENQDESSWLSTHPSFDERIEKIQSTKP